MGKKRGKDIISRLLSSGAWGKAKLVAFFLVLPVLAGGVLGGFLAFSRTVPSVHELKQEVIPPGTRIYADDDTLIGEIKIIKGQFVPVAKMPPDLLNAVVAVEDAHFWKHGGIDYIAILRAALKDLMEGKIKQGGSTITQQLAKNTFLTPERTFRRKLKEVVLATRIEKSLEKEEIIEIYLNRAYFGHGAYGVQMAAKTYFDKPVEELSLPEAAIIAGLLKAPSTYSPISNFKRAKERQEIVLRRMEEEGYISREQRVNTLKTPLYLSTRKDAEATNNYFIDYVRDYIEQKYGSEMLYKGGMKAYTTLNRQAQESAQRSLQKGLRDLDKRRGWRGVIGHVELAELEAETAQRGYRTTPITVGDRLKATVLKVDKFEAAVRAENIDGKLPLKGALWAGKRFDESLGEPVAMKDFNLTKILKPGDIVLVQVDKMEGEAVEFSLDQEPEVQGALVAVEPYSGYIRALVGGYDFSVSQYNRGLYAKRQVGSAFKPMIYALAMKSGYSPASIIVDEEIAYGEVERDEAGNIILNTPTAADEGETEKEIYMPKNYDEVFYGPTRLREALTYSRNVVTVKLADSLGVGKIIDFSRKLGFTSDIQYDLSIALGSMSVTPLELTAAYNAFANRGIRMEPIGIKYVTDSGGRIVESNEPKGEEVMTQQSAFLITSMLQSVVTHGTGWRAKALKRPVAGKTGTTNEYKDAWFLGYTTDMVTGVWVGYDTPKFLGPEETGSRAAAPIWVDFMLTLPQSADSGQFPVPKGIITRMIDPETGLLANRWTKDSMLEYFIPGTEPQKESGTIFQTEEPENLLLQPQ